MKEENFPHNRKPSHRCVCGELWKLKVKSLSRVHLFATPWTVVLQAPPSMEFSRQECWSGVPLVLGPPKCLEDSLGMPSG